MKANTEVAMQQSAVVLTHPQFDREKVDQVPRRGRLPKGVVAMRKPREVAEAVQPPADPMDPLTAAYRMLDMMQCTLEVTRRRLAEYEKGQRRTG